MTDHSRGRLSSRPGGPTGPPVEPGVHALAAAGLPDALLVVPPSLPAPAPLLVFFHGAGGRPTTSLPLVEDAAAAAGAVVLLPASRAATWDLLSGRLGPDVAAVDTALTHVLSHVDVDRVALGGFSDGGSYALSLGLANGDLAGALIAFSPGFVAPPEQVGLPRVRVVHGDADAVLPVDRCGRRVVAQLRDAGYEVAYEEFAGGHVVRPGDVDAAFTWWLG